MYVKYSIVSGLVTPKTRVELQSKSTSANSQKSSIIATFVLYMSASPALNRDKAFSRKQGRVELVLQIGKWI